MRLIDADELKERIRKTLGIKSFDNLLPSEKTIVKQIDMAPTIHHEPHWIPVTEEPPEVGKSVLICDADGDICLGHRTNYGGYFPDFCEDKIKNVRAWMPLPEPYKGVTE